MAWNVSAYVQPVESISMKCNAMQANKSSSITHVEAMTYNSINNSNNFYDSWYSIDALEVGITWNGTVCIS